MVPKGMLAIDAGANLGVYSYWMAQSASAVVAFEPQPRLAKHLERSKIPKLRVHNVALSDHAGSAELRIPRAHGEASLRHLDVPADTVDVPLRTLDSFDLKGVGFMKVDVEGHEEPLLHGAERTLQQNSPMIYIEVEERHNPGGLSRIVSWLEVLGYTQIQYRQHGVMHPFEEFDLERDQLKQQPQTAAYVNNFLFSRP
ncbi:MAG: FkbM family methyltransferase [Mycolicibacterium rufum]|nr:FkbM family methyltransferase [Mycolicibacterium rufum]